MSTYRLFILTVAAAFAPAVHAVTVAVSADNGILEQQAGGNYGTNTSMAIGYYTSVGQEHRALIQFDLAAYSGQTVNSAVLNLYRNFLYGNTASTIDIHRVTSPWTENGSTWASADVGSPWTLVGGDFDATPSASTSLPGSGEGWFTWDITGLVQGWLDGSYPNYGLVAKQSAFAGGTYANYFTRQSPTNPVFLDLDAVPESAAALWLPVAAALLARRRRRGAC